MRSIVIKSLYAFLSLGLMMALTGVQTVYAAGIVVNSTVDNTTTDGLCTLREAITNASDNAATHIDCTAGSGDDVITFELSSCPCTITLTNELNIGTNLTITGPGGASNLVINGNNTNPVIGLGSATLNLSHLTITGGANPAGSGGGIYMNNTSTLNISQSVISGNSAQHGGGIYNNGGTITLLNSTVSNNIASVDGGGIYANGPTATTTITNSTITGNSATGVGIAIVNGGPMAIRNSTIANNTAGGGGSGIFYAGAGAISLWNTIVANSSCNATVVNGGNNIDSGSTCGFGSANNSLSDTDPLLGTLSGSPAYFPLNTGSPAIDAGDNATCAAAPVSNTSQNGVSRTQGTQCDIGAFETLVIFTLTSKSVNTNDGWILESTETSGNGGTLNSIATNFSLGDDVANRQYRAILHFDTSLLPDTAVITSATLKIKKQGVMGTDPFTLLGDLKASVRKPAFGAATLALSDFKSAPGKNNVATFSSTPVSNWYSALVNNTGRVYINRLGTTQFRLAFTTDDNNDFGADLMKFYSGNAGAANRPQLIIQYYIP